MKRGKEKISIAECRSILQKDGSSYSDNEVLEVREFLYRLAEMEYEVFLKSINEENTELNQAA